MLFIFYIFLLFYIFKILNKSKTISAFLFWIIYLTVESFVSFIGISLFKNYTNQDLKINFEFYYIFFIFISTSIFVYNLSKAHIYNAKKISFLRSYKIKDDIGFRFKKYKKILLIMFFGFILVSFKMFSTNFSLLNFLSSNNSRQLVSRETSGFEFVIYKFGLILIGLIAVKGTLRKISFYEKILFGVILFFYFLYGGRFLVFASLLIFCLLFYDKKLVNVSISKLIFVIFSYYIVSISYANIRYYSSVEKDMVKTFTYDRIASTALMQLGGNLVDFSLVSNNVRETDLLEENFFPTILEGFLPSVVRDSFFESFFEKRTNFGATFAGKIGQDDNGLRLNFTNEIFFSFGYFGVVIYGFLVGLVFSFFDRENKIQNRIISLFFFIQLLSLHILGSNTFSNTVILTIIFSIIINKIFYKKHGIINYSKL